MEPSGRGSRGSVLVGVLVVLVLSAACGVSLVEWRETSDRLARVERAQRSDIAALKRNETETNGAGVLGVKVLAMASGLDDRVSALEQQVGGSSVLATASLGARLDTLEAEFSSFRFCVNRVAASPGGGGYC
jgi:hypothetical protein